MEVYRIGEIIRVERKRKKISQEELCFGLCSVTTLSRIENGSQKPSLKVEEALLERLGHSTENLIIYADGLEIKKHRLEEKIRLGMMDLEDTEKLIEEYRRLITVRGTEGVLEKQFLIMSVAIQNLYQNRESLTEIRQQLNYALRLTVPEFEEGMMDKTILLTSTEIEILNNLALVDAKEGNGGRSIKIFKLLVDFLEQDTLCENITRRHYNMLTCNLVKQLEIAQKHDEAERYSQKGIDYCKRNRRMNGLPQLLYYNAVANAQLGRYELAIERYEQAVVLFKLVDKNKIALAVEEELNDLKCQQS